MQKRGRCFLFVKSWFGHPYIYNSDILLYMNKINKIRIFIAGLKKFYVIKVLYNKTLKEFQRSKVVFLIFDGKMKTCLTLSLLGYLKTIFLNYNKTPKTLSFFVYLMVKLVIRPQSPTLAVKFF